MPCRGAALAAPAALRVAIRMPARARPRHWKEGCPLVREERCRSKGKGQRLGLGRGGSFPGLGPSPRSHAVPSLQQRPRPPTEPPQTRASGPAVLTAHPWPERSKGLPNPPRAAVEVAARDSLPDWERRRPLVGGGGEERGALERTPGGGGAHHPGAGREARPSSQGPPRRDLGVGASGR